MSCNGPSTTTPSKQLVIRCSCKFYFTYNGGLHSGGTYQGSCVFYSAFTTKMHPLGRVFYCASAKLNIISILPVSFKDLIDLSVTFKYTSFFTGETGWMSNVGRIYVELTPIEQLICEESLEAVSRQYCPTQQILYTCAMS